MNVEEADAPQKQEEQFVELDTLFVSVCDALRNNYYLKSDQDENQIKKKQPFDSNVVVRAFFNTLFQREKLVQLLPFQINVIEELSNRYTAQVLPVIIMDGNLCVKPLLDCMESNEDLFAAYAANKCLFTIIKWCIELNFNIVFVQDIITQLCNRMNGTICPTSVSMCFGFLSYLLKNIDNESIDQNSLVLCFPSIVYVIPWIDIWILENNERLSLYSALKFTKIFLKKCLYLESLSIYKRHIVEYIQKSLTKVCSFIFLLKDFANAFILRFLFELNRFIC
jgi:hypothetical protein